MNELFSHITHIYICLNLNEISYFKRRNEMVRNKPRRIQTGAKRFTLVTWSQHGECTTKWHHLGYW